MTLGGGESRTAGTVDVEMQTHFGSTVDDARRRQEKGGAVVDQCRAVSVWHRGILGIVVVNGAGAKHCVAARR